MSSTYHNIAISGLYWRFKKFFSEFSPTDCHKLNFLIVGTVVFCTNHSNESTYAGSEVSRVSQFSRFALDI